MVISLGWLSPATSRGLPAARTTRAGSRCLLGLAPTGGYRAAPVARRAVGSYPTFSPLPLDKGRSVFCGPFRRLAAPRRYLAVCPVELGLSSARHSDRRTATITPYRLPRERYRSRKGRGKPQRASRLNRRTRLSGGSRPEVFVPAASPGSQKPSFSSNTMRFRPAQSRVRSSAGASSTACTPFNPRARSSASTSRVWASGVNKRSGRSGRANPLSKPSENQSAGGWERGARGAAGGGGGGGRGRRGGGGGGGGAPAAAAAGGRRSGGGAGPRRGGGGGGRGRAAGGRRGGARGAGAGAGASSPFSP